MSKDDLSRLNDQFGCKGELAFRKGRGGLTLVDICNEHAKATISLQGAQVLQWTPHSEKPVIWLSPKAKFAPRTSIRGGVPICWPWFGYPEGSENLPNHGFARTAAWELVETDTTSNGDNRLVFRMQENEDLQEQWPHRASLGMSVVVGEHLEMCLTTRNEGDAPVVISKALHSYFEVSDIRRVSIHGLDNCYYLDKVDGGSIKRQSGSMTIAEETDRIYLDSTADCLIEDPGLGRCLRIAKSGSRSTVVWNPWEKSGAMEDIGERDYLRMVCVEAANAADDQVTIDPGGEHEMGVRYSVERFA